MDLSQEKGLGSLDRGNGEHPEADLDVMKSCTDCRTTKTPLWRGGPSGPKSLCNACGIRYRKRRREVLGLKEGGKKREEMKTSMNMGFSVKQLVLRRHELMKHRTALIQKLKQGILREEEEAAILLMALSSGLLYASNL